MIRVIWLRLRSDGTLVSGPHYSNPSLEDPAKLLILVWTQMVIWYLCMNILRESAGEVHISKILENDSIREICRFH
ncbi:MAG: hypothetical protein IPP49_18935 [Saprospiraceae bacterium]|nr:hypothetical protein [Saprospiraceae bacterium]